MNQTETIKFKKLHENATIPTRGTTNSAGFDLYALQDAVIVGGDGSVIIPTGIAVQLISGTYGRVAARSGLAVKEHLAVNAGVIDIDYDQGIGIVAYCTKNNHHVVIHKGDRIAQLIPEFVSYAGSEEVEIFNRSFEVAHNGWGSTGR